MMHPRGSRHRRRRRNIRRILRLNSGHAEHALVFMREHLDEALLRVGPMLQDPSSSRATSEVTMAFEEPSHFGDIFIAHKRLKIDAGFIAAARREIALIIVDKGS